MDEAKASSAQRQSLPPKRKFLNDHGLSDETFYHIFFVSLVVDLRLLTELCAKIAPKWRSIGIQLSLSEHELDIIQANYCGYPDMVQNCLRRVFDWWLKNEQDITPEKLAQAIHIVGEHKVEVEIKKKFGKYVPLFLSIIISVLSQV